MECAKDIKTQEFENADYSKKEQEKLTKLFGDDIKNHEDIISITKMMQSLKIIAIKPKASFFDALYYVMEHNLYVGRLREIWIEMDPDVDYSNNVYLCHAVLNELILYSDLTSLTLNNFDPSMLVAVLATIDAQKKLKKIDLSHNSLTTDNFIMVLSAIPDVNANLDFSCNELTNEDTVALFLSNQKKTKSYQQQLQK